MENLEVTIIPEDFAKAPYGYHIYKDYEEGPFGGCVLYWALKRIFPEEEKISVGATHAYIKGRAYAIRRSEWGADVLTQEFLSPSGFSMQKINELSKKAKESLEGIPTVSLSLTPH